MRRIEKRAEPACLEDLRQTPGADWSSVGGAQKQEMRKAAWDEQHGLCAYCMSRLPEPSAQTMKIEHYHARSVKKEHWFVWDNLLGVCLGDIGIESGGDRYHCDTYRGQLPKEKQDLHVHPAQFPPDAGKRFSCTKAGELIPAKNLDDQTKACVQSTIDKLNLNIWRLKNNRKRVLFALQERLYQDDAPASIKALLEQAKSTDAQGRLKEYAEVAVQYLEKKLRQHGHA